MAKAKTIAASSATSSATPGGRLAGKIALVTGAAGNLGGYSATAWPYMTTAYPAQALP